MSATRKEQQRQRKQIEAIGRLSAPVAHDINNLLSGILGYSELLSSESDMRFLNSYANEISQAGKRIASLIRVLLIFSRKYASRPEALDLNTVIGEIEKFIPYVLGPKIHFAATKGSELWLVRADGAMIKQIIVTLAIDVRELLPEGGDFMLETRNLSVESVENAKGLPAPGRYVQLSALASGDVRSDSILSCVSRSGSDAADPGKEASSEISNVYEIVQSLGGRLFTEVRSGKNVRIEAHIPAICDDSEK